MPKLLTVPEAIDYLRISRDTFYKLVRDGSLPTVRIGARRLVSIHDLEKFVDEHTEVAS